MNRRALILSGLACAIPAVAGAHTPYGQWVTYRRKHLLIGCHRQDPETYAQAKVMVEHLAHDLPSASARVARAPSAGRVASLMGTDQLDLAILSIDDALGLSAGAGSFSPFGKIPVGLIAMLKNDKCLIAHTTFREDHAQMIAATINEAPIISRDAQPPKALGWHNGAIAWQDSTKDH